MTQDQARIAQLEEELTIAKADLRAAEAECESHKEQARSYESHAVALREQMERLEREDEAVDSEVVAEIRRAIHRGHYQDAIDLADRNLPRRLRYAA